jgi:gamma-carbonic anhydrase
MALIKEFKNRRPEWASNVFVAENATLIGDIRIGSQSSIWFGAILRGDVGSIRIGNETNIQDGAVIHSTDGISTVEIGDEVTVGHRAIVHGAKVGNRVLVGMGAVVLDNAVVNDDVIIAANAVVLAGSVLESGGLYAGAPAKRVKELSEAQKETLRDSAAHYVEISRTYLESTMR